MAPKPDIDLRIEDKYNLFHEYLHLEATLHRPRLVMAFPQDFADGISDEYYIRNLADGLFRKKIK